MNFILPFVGNDYYCESGTSLYKSKDPLFPNDPLWDGQGCPGDEATCCTSPKMPWFVKMIHETISDDIELNTCGINNYQTYVYGTPIDLVELYIK